jgi:hypothetical protein
VNIPQAEAKDCSIPTSLIGDPGIGRDAIPAIVGPRWVVLDRPGVPGYLLDTDRVLGMIIDGQPYAMPLNVFWWHEIINMDIGGRQLLATYCPLTGSSMIFERDPVEGVDFGVTGLLYQSNLIMFDRRGGESFWPQMMGQARCGPNDGMVLPRVAGLDVTWSKWRAMYPHTLVLDGDQGHDRDYTSYPYGNYESLSNESYWYPVSRVDRRRPQRERVLGIPGEGSEAQAFPFIDLALDGPVAAVHTTHRGRPVVVLWEWDAEGAGAYYTDVGGEPLEFAATETGIRDLATGTRWTVDGLAVSGGSMVGTRLEPVTEAYTAFWGSWAQFFPDTRLWLAPEE